MRQSTTAKRAFKECQVTAGFNKPKPLVQDVHTHWNLTMLMFQHFKDLKAAVILCMASENFKVEVSRQEWDAIAGIITVLKPFYEVTVEMSGEKYVTSSICIPMRKLLLHAAMTLEAELLHSNPGGMGFKLITKMQVELNKHFNHIEEVEALYLATLLDPRFKRLGFKNDGKAQTAIDQLKKKVFDLTNQAEDKTVKTSQATVVNSIWKTFDLEVERRNKKTKNGMTLAGVAELAAYLEGSNISRSFSPKLWWNQQKDMFPTLFKLARRYLSVPGSSVPSERAFLAAGNIITVACC